VASGGALLGISVEFLAHLARPGADEMVVTADLSARKTLMLARSDAIVIVAGGLGTLDEATEVLEQKKHGLHTLPVVLLNTAGFYDGLIIQLRRMESEGFLPMPLAQLVTVADTGAQVLGLIAAQSEK
jgi:uncharacterized protein (TIGR00730 family)